MKSSYSKNKYTRSVDEMFGRSPVSMNPKKFCRDYWNWFSSQSINELENASNDAVLLFKKFGITFNVYGDDEEPNATTVDRIIPFDLIPRIISHVEWDFLENGLIQRVRALNAFLSDVYHEGKIFSSGLMPPEIIYGNSQYRFQILQSY